jgi:hypothetical protein
MKKTDEQLMINAMYYISVGLIIAIFVVVVWSGGRGATIERLQNEKDSLIRCIAIRDKELDSINSNLYVMQYELAKYVNTMDYLYEKNPKVHEKVINYFLHEIE